MKSPTITPTADTLLIDFVEKYYCPKRQVSQRSLETYRDFARQFETALGRVAKISDLPALARLKVSKHAMPMLLTIWRAASDLRLVDFDEQLPEALADLEIASYRLAMIRKNPGAIIDKPRPDMPLMDFIMLHHMKTAHHRGKVAAGVSLLYKLRRMTKQVADVLGRPPLVSDLTPQNRTLLLDSLKLARVSVIRLFDDCWLAVWRYAADLGISTLPEKLKRGSRSKYRDPNDETKRFQLEESEGTLWGLCKTFFRLRVKIRDEKTRSYYGYAIKAFGAHLGRQPLVTDLNDDTVTEWLIATIETSKAISTARERIGRVLTLWKWAAQRGIVEQFPTVERPQVPDPDPIALTEEELGRLFKSAGEERGEICGIHASDWWSAWLAFILKTAERYGAARQLRWDWVNLTTGVVSIPANVRKGHRKHAVYHLEPEVVALLKKIQSPKRELVFPWHRSDGTYYNVYGRILERAGLPNDKKHKTHSLRATHATLMTILGGDASRSLGHGDRMTTDRHYIDKRHLPPDLVKLPNPWIPVELAPSPADESLLIVNSSATDSEAFGWL